MHQLRLAGGRIAPARLHPPCLEIATVGAGGNFAISGLRGQPDFQVIGLRGAEAHVAGAQQHLAVRQAEFLQHRFGAAGHALVLGIGLLGSGDADQLDLLELVLADHPAHIATTAAGLGAEAHRMRGHAQRQALGLDDLVADDVGQRHFTGGNQVALALAELGREQVFLELRQLPGAAHRIGIDQQRHVGFLVAVLAGVQVQHELRQRTMQPRQLSAQHGEARAAQFGGSFAIQPALAHAEFDMVLHVEIEAARRAPAQLLDIVRFLAAQRHRGIGKIGNTERDGFDLVTDLVQAQFRGLQLLAEACHFRHHRGHVLALRLQHADLLAAGIAQVLQFLGADLQLLALRFQCFEATDIQLEAATDAQAFGEIGRLGAQQGRIEHGDGHSGK